MNAAFRTRDHARARAAQRSVAHHSSLPPKQEAEASRRPKPPGAPEQLKRPLRRLHASVSYSYYWPIRFCRPVI
eukprot:6210562-Pleurochrysis_carterae.AAC.5